MEDDELDYKPVPGKHIGTKQLISEEKYRHYETLEAQNKVLRDGLGRIKREYENWSKEDAPYQLSCIARGILAEAKAVEREGEL